MPYKMTLSVGCCAVVPRLYDQIRTVASEVFSVASWKLTQISIPLPSEKRQGSCFSFFGFELEWRRQRTYKSYSTMGRDNNRQDPTARFAASAQNTAASSERARSSDFFWHTPRSIGTWRLRVDRVGLNFLVPERWVTKNKKDHDPQEPKSHTVSGMP